MKWGFLYVFMFCFTQLFSQEYSGKIKSLFEEGGYTKLDLVISNVTRSYYVEVLRSEIQSPGHYKVLESVYDRNKKIAELFIVSTHSVTIDDIEILLSSIGIVEIEYNNLVLKTHLLSEYYQPVVPEEFILKTRN